MYIYQYAIYLQRVSDLDFFSLIENCTEKEIGSYISIEMSVKSTLQLF